MRGNTNNLFEETIEGTYKKQFTVTSIVSMNSYFIYLVSMRYINELVDICMYVYTYIYIYTQT